LLSDGSPDHLLAFWEQRPCRLCSPRSATGTREAHSHAATDPESALLQDGPGGQSAETDSSRWRLQGPSLPCAAWAVRSPPVPFVGPQQWTDHRCQRLLRVPSVRPGEQAPNDAGPLAGGAALSSVRTAGRVAFGAKCVSSTARPTRPGGRLVAILRLVAPATPRIAVFRSPCAA
jgi:hypothetical protein